MIRTIISNGNRCITPNDRLRLFGAYSNNSNRLSVDSNSQQLCHISSSSNSIDQSKAAIINHRSFSQLTGCDQPRILITGALGQLGKGLAAVMRDIYGKENVIMSDVIKPPRRLWQHYAPYIHLDILNAPTFESIVVNYQIDWVIHLSAILSATGESNVPLALRINCEGVHNVLQICNTIGAFGPTTPRHRTPDLTIQRPRTIYGVSKVHAELLGEYMHEKFALDFRSLRFPGVISATKPGGGTTDYAIEIFYDAINKGKHVCYLRPDTRLPMIYEEDCLRSVVQLLEAPDANLAKRTYNVAGMSFTPAEIAAEIQLVMPNFQIEYNVCPIRQKIADSWPESLDDSCANTDWHWRAKYDLRQTVDIMFRMLKTDHHQQIENRQQQAGV